LPVLRPAWTSSRNVLPEPAPSTAAAGGRARAQGDLVAGEPRGAASLSAGWVDCEGNPYGRCFQIGTNPWPILTPAERPVNDDARPVNDPATGRPEAAVSSGHMLCWPFPYWTVTDETKRIDSRRTALKMKVHGSAVIPGRARRPDRKASSLRTEDHTALKDLLCRGVCKSWGAGCSLCQSKAARLSLGFPRVPSCSLEASVAIDRRWDAARRARRSRRSATCGTGRADRI
jgi:hypothetical protein